MSKKKTSKNNVHLNRAKTHTASNPSTSVRDRIALIDHELDDIAEEMDLDYMTCGKTCSRLFRSLVDAAVALPDMELYTKLISIDNNRNCLTVTLYRRKLEEEVSEDNEQKVQESDGEQSSRTNHAYDSKCKDCIDCEGCDGCNGCAGCAGPGKDHDGDYPEYRDDEEEEHLHEY